ncbi:MAG: ester cyclase [Ktedonobacteraceae bacterium]|nr:ester cyclase [Ktedonobacteraceae bacterium]
MSAIDTVKTFVTALQSGDMQLAADVMAEDFKLSGLTPQELDEREFLVLQSRLLAAMPDFSYNLADVRKEGNEVRATIRVTGTQTGDLSLPMLGLEPIQATGLAVDLAQMETSYHVVDGKVASMHAVPVAGGGLPGLVQQVGTELPLMEREKTFNDPAYPEETADTHNIAE